MATGLRGLIVVFWRAGPRIHEALALGEALDPRRGALLVRRGKGGRRRGGMDYWAWDHLGHGSGHVPSYRSARCSASQADRRAGAHG